MSQGSIGLKSLILKNMQTVESRLRDKLIQHRILDMVIISWLMVRPQFINIKRPQDTDTYEVN
jgi:hypothetical protein